ncbi:MAG: ExbD/TolR family protein [Bilophila wadsworthia]
MLNLRPKAARDDEPDLTPLIDMVFILLIFFILAASFAVQGIDLDLPPAQRQALSGVVNPAAQDGSFLCERHTRGPRRCPGEAAKPRAGLSDATRTACAQGRARRAGGGAGLHCGRGADAGRGKAAHRHGPAR